MSVATPAFGPLFAEAFERRRELAARLAAEGTDTWRLFHGSAEGAPGVTLDRYGEVALLQTFHRPLTPEQLDEVRAALADHAPDLQLVWNDRSEPGSRICNRLDGEQLAYAETPRMVRELGVHYHFQARHGGQDPWLFLDLRAGRRRVMAEAAGKSVLNLFAYTGGIGLAAARGGARFVVNVDFAESSLHVARRNIRANQLPTRPRCILSDVFPAVRQLAGISQPRIVRGRRMPPFPTLEPQQFDLVVLDPPRYAKSPFGVVDLVHDYQALFKPSLLATAAGGSLLCCNNVAEVDRESWLDQLERATRKAGRQVREAEWINPEDDFPSFDGHPPLKMLLLRV